MKSKTLRVLLLALAFGVAAYFVVCTGAPPHKETIADAPTPPLKIASPDVALTFAIGLDEAGARKVVLVTGVDAARIQGVDLEAALGRSIGDPFDVLQDIGWDDLAALATSAASATPAVELTWDRLLPTAEQPTNIGFGTNYAGHGEEVGNDEVFAFPKYGTPIAAVSTFTGYSPGRLLDYEVEICVRFDRDIASLQDFDAALKGFFLCGDTTDRAALIRHVPIGEEPLSGLGFADGKSGAQMMPTGPFLVVPKDWRSFVDNERITTRLRDELRDELRQDTTGAGLILGVREIVSFVLERGSASAWDYQGTPASLIDGGVIPEGMTILTGTPEGVMFEPPGTREMACGAVAYFCLGKFLGDNPMLGFLIERFVSARAGNGYYLEPGDVVVHESDHLGRIEFRIAESP